VSNATYKIELTTSGPAILIIHLFAVTQAMCLQDDCNILIKIKHREQIYLERLIFHHTFVSQFN